MAAEVTTGEVMAKAALVTAAGAATADENTPLEGPVADATRPLATDTALARTAVGIGASDDVAAPTTETAGLTIDAEMADAALVRTAVGIGVTEDAAAPTNETAGSTTEAEMADAALPTTAVGMGAIEDAATLTKDAAPATTADGRGATDDATATAMDRTGLANAEGAATAPETTAETTGTAEDATPFTKLTALAGALTTAAADDNTGLIASAEALALHTGVIVSVTVAAIPAFPERIMMGAAAAERSRGKQARTARGM
jgi:hypothetical protein